MTQQEFFNRYTYSPSRDRIGGGGFGTVYKAYDNLLHREVALKVSEVKTTSDGQKTFSLKDEFEALAHVPKHPNIANYEEFYSFEDHRGLCDYAIMQYYPDGNLSNAIKQGLTAGQKEDIATQLLEGIDFLHKHKVVHRDLKPGNILIVKHGGRIIPLITDFGLSKATGMGENSVFSNSFGAGTPRYSSPEQLQGNPLRLNTDLWSYGAILYELFTGEQLFTAGSGAANTAQADMEVYNKIVNGNVQSLGKMPEKWCKVAERCLVVDAAKRAKDAGELFAIIKGDDDETIGSSSGSGTTTGPKMPTNTPLIDKPSPKDPHSGTSPFKGVGGIQDPLSPTPNDKPTNKKGLWIGLGIAAAVIVALLLLLKPTQEPTPTDPDMQAYEACQTVADYRAYISDYGRNAINYSDAQHKIDSIQTDSIAKVKEDAAYGQCNSITTCASYLDTYPNGRYVVEVKDKKAKLESEANEEELKKEDDAYKRCTSLSGCENYMNSYPQGRYVSEVKAKKAVLELAQPQISINSKGSSIIVRVGEMQFKMIKVEGGTFWMGAQKDDPEGINYDIEAKYDGPVHEVTLSSFYIAETEVTQALWEAVMGTTIRQQFLKAYPGCPDCIIDKREIGDNNPMCYINWNDCQDFLHKLNTLSGKKFRLPTEAEWEFAARGGRYSKGYKYAGSDDVGKVAWRDADYGAWNHVVKRKSPNELGIYDMSGNVRERCSDWLDFDYYKISPSVDPQGPSGQRKDYGHVERGGDFRSGASQGCQVWYRGCGYGDERRDDCGGFRLALSL